MQRNEHAPTQKYNQPAFTFLHTKSKFKSIYLNTLQTFQIT